MRKVLKSKTPTFALALSLCATLLNANSTDSIAIPKDAIIFEGKENGAGYTNTGDPYAEFSAETLTLSFKGDLQNKTIVFRNTFNTQGNNVIQWYAGISGVVTSGVSRKTPQNLILNAKDSILVLEALDPNQSNTSKKSKSTTLGEGGKGELSITTKELHIGSGKYQYTNLFGGIDGSSDKHPTGLYLMQGDTPIQHTVQSDVYVHSDGFLAVGNMNEAAFSQSIQGDLNILSGGLAIVAMGKGSKPDLHITGKAYLKDSQIMTFLPTQAQDTFTEWKVLSAEKGIVLEGSHKIRVLLSYFLEDFVDIQPTHIDYGYALQRSVDELYKHTLDVRGNTLYATPQLTDFAKSQGVVNLIRERTNQIAIGFYNNSLENYKNTGKPDYLASIKGLYNYLTKQGYTFDSNNGAITSPSQAFLLASAESPKTQVSESVAPITTSGFDSIDSKLSLIQSGINNTLAETLKNSSNDLLAVNFVNTLSQPHNNTPLALLEEIKETYKNENLLKQTRENLGVKLSIAQRLAGYALKSTFQGLNASNRSSFSGNTSNSLNRNNSNTLSSNVGANINSTFNPNSLPSNALWLNLEGGGVLNGSNFGSNVGFNLGYDTQINQSVLGAYLSYHFMDLKEQSTTLLSHNIEAGLYSRISFFSNEIDLHLRTLLSLANQSLYTQTLIASTSEAKLLSSYTEANLSYGYRFESQDFLSVKPFLGIQVGFAYTPSYSQTGDIQLKFDSHTDTTLDANLGVELRKYFTPNSYLYITPSLSQNILQTQTELKLSQGQALELNSNLVTYAQLLLGGEIDLGKNWSLGMNLGVKQGIYGNQDSKQQWKNQTILIGEIGGVWRF